MGKHTTNPAVVTVAGDGTWSCVVTDMLQGNQDVQMKVDGEAIPGPGGTRAFTAGELTIPYYVGAGDYVSISAPSEGYDVPAPTVRTDDFLLLVINNGSAVTGIEDGWTAIEAAPIFWRLSPSNSYSSARISTDNGFALSARMYAFRNIHHSTPFDRSDTATTLKSNQTTWAGTTQTGIASSSMAIFVWFSTFNAVFSSIGGGIDTAVAVNVGTPRNEVLGLGYDTDTNGQTTAPSVTWGSSRSGYVWTAALQMA